ncbi:hypothetical protein [Aeoliella mucimassa]|uniref:Uncharacterized protein n=1 Tax=Aeoliella mucimassa TaxID=2527972 RepID=A0A518AU23_9BACT|nr:hypothetical protein [Aeoliella mucimassa]QDU58229.1 hypothetical protein Pan181_44620 [Aeoliella mucimassa]
MALNVKCPCGKQYSVPESAAGKKGKCNSCGLTFVIPSPELSASNVAPAVSGQSEPVTASAEQGNKLAPHDDTENYNPFAAPTTSSAPDIPSSGVGTIDIRSAGLSWAIYLVFYGAVITLVSPVLLVTSLVISLVFRSDAIWIFIVGALGLVLLGYLLNTAGRVLCLVRAPSLGNAGLLVASIACDLSSIALTVLSVADITDHQITSLAGLLALASWLLFAFYLKAIAKLIGDASLVDEARRLTLILGVAVALPIVNSLLVLLFGSAMIAFGLGSFAIMLYGLVMYMLLIRHTAKAVRP